jgi:hypothetical protein
MKMAEDKKIAAANDLFTQVRAMSDELEDADEVKAQLILEYAKDAIELYGATNQERKVELRRLIERVERIVSPDSIDSLKKRAERVVLKFVYPRRPILRNTLLVTIGVALLIVAIVPVTAFWGYLTSTTETLPSQDKESQLSTDAKVLLILFDVSASLADAEVNKAVSLAAEIIDNLPDNSVYAIYPIQVNELNLPPLVSETASSYLSEPERTLRRETLKRRIHGLKEKNLGPSHSCILNSVFSARRILDEMTNPTHADKRMELVIISDMVEECDETPLGRISLNKSDTEKEIALIRKHDHLPYPNLLQVQTTIFLPLAEDLASSNPRRTLSYYDIKEFWRIVFNRCGLKNNDQIEWVSSGALPYRLRTPRA